MWNLFSISWKILWWLVFQLYLKEPRWPVHIVIFFIFFPETLSQGLCSLWKKCGMEEAWSLNENCYYSSLFYHIMELLFLLYVTRKPKTFPKQYLEWSFCFTFHASEKFTIVSFVMAEDWTFYCYWGKPCLGKKTYVNWGSLNRFP